jgi:hypothetical protein
MNQDKESSPKQSRAEPNSKVTYAKVRQSEGNSLIQDADDMDFDRSASDGEGQARMNFLTPDFSQRVLLYLKPQQSSSCFNFCLLLLDTMLCWTFLAMQSIWAFGFLWPSVNEQVMFYLICYGLVACVFAYCLLDGLRFLSTWHDRLLYIISCILMKPILLPVIAPGHLFQSNIANRKFGNQYKFKVDGIEQTNFMLAVQETNFLLSFTMATLNSSTTLFVVILENIYTLETVLLIVTCLVYMVFGFGVSVYLYGRKTYH